ncbi:MAG: deoxyribodipyrimidine photo-lyase [Phycisphaerae bacterium]
MATLVWFRADLRTVDNTALALACACDEPVVGVFLIAGDQWRRHDWATVKVDLVLRTLGELSRRLRELNIALLVRRADRFDDAPGVLVEVAREQGCTRLFFNREYEVNERRRDEAVIAAFEEAGLEALGFDDQTVMAPGSVLTKELRPYTVFTPFKKAWIAAARERGGVLPKKAPAVRARMVGAPEPVPDRVAGFTGLVRPDLWPGGEEHARDRLKKFTRGRIASYKQDRDTPGINGTSVLSPYLAIGAISPRQCLKAALEANEGRYDEGNAGCVQWISELVWREFYKHLIAAFPRLCMGRAFKPETEKLRWREDDEGFAAWCEGRTGVPIVDAAMRQLVQTGWMHNRLRMITAMYLTKDLFIDWRRGERFFMQNLVDGDLAQNNGGWQWSASTGTDAAPYFRIFNPVSQSRACDPEGKFIRKFVPELAGLDDDAIHEPWTLPPMARSGIRYPEKPVADHVEARKRVLEEFKRIGAGKG